MVVLVAFLLIPYGTRSSLYRRPLAYSCLNISLYDNDNVTPLLIKFAYCDSYTYLLGNRVLMLDSFGMKP